MPHPDPDRKGSSHVCCSCQVLLCSFEVVKGGRRAVHAGLRKADLPCECAVTGNSRRVVLTSTLQSLACWRMAGFARMPREKDAFVKAFR